jgi:uncharacterized protein YjiS (DUF1127 family)
MAGLEKELAMSDTQKVVRMIKEHDASRQIASVGHGDLTDSRERTRDSELRRPPTASYSRIAEDPSRSAKPRTASPRWSTSIASPVIKLWSRMRRALRIRRTITRLEALDDHMLKDIGIHRSQIEGAARHHNGHYW